MGLRSHSFLCENESSSCVCVCKCVYVCVCACVRVYVCARVRMCASVCSLTQLQGLGVALWLDVIDYESILLVLLQGVIVGLNEITATQGKVSGRIFLYSDLSQNRPSSSLGALSPTDDLRSWNWLGRSDVLRKSIQGKLKKISSMKHLFTGSA